MGKKAAIRSLIVSVSLVSYHKMLHEKGDRPEAKRHLEDEIRNYSADAFEKAQEYKWSHDELQEIREKSVKRTAKILKNKYPDIKFTDAEIKEKVVDTMQEFLL